MNKTLLALCCGLGLAAIAHADPTLPYTDDFNGSGPGNPAPNIQIDDTGTDFWRTYPSSLTTPEQAKETAGEADLTSATATGASVIQLALSSSFNFFAQPLTFSLSGLSIAGSAAAASQQFVFAVQDGANQIYSAADSSAAVSVTGDNHLVFTMRQVGSAFGSAILVNSSLAGSATGIALTLDGTALTYNLVISEGATAETFSGNLPAISQTLWGPNGAKGSSALTFGVFDNQPPVVNGVPDSDATARVGAVGVAAVPEPSTWALMASGLGLLVAGQRLRLRRS